MRGASGTAVELKKTPLHETHIRLGARLTAFAGWEMPVSYAGVIEEHRNVRRSCGLFDISHMGEISVSGPGALDAVQRLATNDIERARDNGCQYTLLCNEDGGVLDDCVVYRFGKERFIFCVNASNTEKAFNWINARAGKGASVRDLSRDYAGLALQGPLSAEVMKAFMEDDPSGLKRYHFMETKLLGHDAIVSRTGYTGEDGFEIYASPAIAERLWEAVMDAGRGFGIMPVGLGARDTLRLEMGYPLYGHELTEDTTPLEAGLKRFVGLDKPDFIGREALRKQDEKGLQRSLVGIEMLDAGIPRQGYGVSASGEGIGFVTSGTMSPSLKRPIGMAYVDAGHSATGSPVEVVIRSRPARAVVAGLPFYSTKKKLNEAVQPI